MSSISRPIVPSQWTPIETKYFSGRALLRVRGYDAATEPYFHDRTRLQSVIIQGQFKRSFSAGQVQTGQEFKSPVRLPPLTSVMFAMLQAVATDLRTEISPVSGLLTLSSVLRTAQRVNVSSTMIDWSLVEEVREDTKLFGGFFSDQNRDWKSRRRFFNNTANLNSIQLSTGVYYTFEFFNSLVDLSTFELFITSRWKLRLEDYLKGQPIRLMARAMNEHNQSWESFDDEDLLWDFVVSPIGRKAPVT